MTIEQIEVGFNNFSYIIYDKESASVVDPSSEISHTLDFLKNNNLVLEYIILTHYHSDHTFKTKDLKNIYPDASIVASEKDGKQLNIKKYITVKEGSILKLNDVTLKFMLTPGHTPGGICILVDNEALLTGDTLFIGNCGRADLIGGNIYDLFNSLQRIKNLSNDLIIYPGHNYGHKPFDSLKNQKKTNITLLANNIEEFKMIP
jgi:glyoxylase-like metal-dependent hydrolase (beta-lactamase superfamily II)